MANQTFIGIPSGDFPEKQNPDAEDRFLLDTPDGIKFSKFGTVLENLTAGNSPKFQEESYSGKIIKKFLGWVKPDGTISDYENSEIGKYVASNGGYTDNKDLALDVSPPVGGSVEATNIHAVSGQEIYQYLNNSATPELITNLQVGILKRDNTVDSAFDRFKTQRNIPVEGGKTYTYYGYTINGGVSSQYASLLGVRADGSIVILLDDSASNSAIKTIDVEIPTDVVRVSFSSSVYDSADNIIPISFKKKPKLSIIGRIENLENHTETHPFDGKNIKVCGDSITDEQFSHWYPKFLQKINPASIDNYANSGATWSSTANTAIELVKANWTGGLNDKNCISNQVLKMFDDVENHGHATPDVVMFLASTNDSFFNRPAGDLNAVKDITADYLNVAINDAKVQNVAGAIRHNVEKVLQKFPNVKIIIATAIPIASQDDLTHHFEVYNAVKGTAEILSVPVVNQFAEIGFNRTFERGTSHKFLQDGIHPNDLGGKLQAEFIFKKTKNI